jgi:outer membrane protein TolC
VARAIRTDLERSAWHDVTAAYDAYETNRATVALEQSAVLVARENNRVQETRYRAGATTILDLLAAQNRLVSAEADLVQALYNTRRARAGLEVILGERITFDQGPQ